MTWYVSIAQVTLEQLTVLGYEIVKEGDEFTVYRHVYYDDEYIVEKAKPFLRVEDLNDALALRASIIIRAPGDGHDP